MSEKRFKVLFYHHEDRETVTFECKKCNHLVMAMKW